MMQDFLVEDTWIDKNGEEQTALRKVGVSFTLKGVHPHDLGTILDHEGVAIRAGHHCAMPLMGVLGVPATARASFACYSLPEEVTRLDAAIRKAREVFGP